MWKKKYKEISHAGYQYILKDFKYISAFFVSSNHDLILTFKLNSLMSSLILMQRLKIRGNLVLILINLLQICIICRQWLPWSHEGRNGVHYRACLESGRPWDCCSRRWMDSRDTGQCTHGTVWAHGTRYRERRWHSHRTCMVKLIHVLISSLSHQFLFWIAISHNSVMK